MKAVILVAGEGTRMRPLTNNRPKVMLEVANKPILAHIVHSLKDAGINDFLFVCGYLYENIEKYFGDGRELGIRIEYIEQKDRLGTAHAIECANDFVEDRFLVLNGDALIDTQFVKKLINREETSVLSVKEVNDPSEFGIILTDGKQITTIIEKPKNPISNLANVGVYVFDRGIFDAIEKTKLSERGEYEITESIQILIDEGKKIGYEIYDGGLLQDIGRPWDLLDTNELLLKNIKSNVKGEVEPNATLRGAVIVGEGTLIRNGAYIIGPVIIGKNCVIGPNCFIRASTAIGDGVHIGNAVEIKNSIVMSNTNIGHLSYVGDSIIDENCNFGAGTKVANLRFDKKNVRVMLKGKLVDSGKRKLGVIMGNGVNTGVNSMINAGCVVPSNSFILPGEFKSK